MTILTGTTGWGGEKPIGKKVSLASPLKGLGLSPSLERDMQRSLNREAKKASKDRELLNSMSQKFGLIADIEQLRAVKEAARRDELERICKEQRESRCKMEQAKAPVPWKTITNDTVQENHDKRAPGMFYGFEFPWSEQKIQEFGPEWLTKAFHAAQTLSPDNEVVEIITGGRKITAGNNGAKSLFEVRYKRSEPGLDTKLFAKLPYPMTPETKVDRLSSSVRKQPMDWSEVNTYRLFEANLPFKTPKYYWGDISAETSNFCLILGRIPFAELKGPSKQKLQAFEVEGPYDKCKDHLLKSPAIEYYTVIAKKIAMLGGLYVAGNFASEETVKGGAMIMDIKGDGFKMMMKMGSLAPNQAAQTITTGINFISKTAKTLYPEYVQTDLFEKKYKSICFKLNAYAYEIGMWKEGPDCKHRGIGHMNCNIDNAYFWRDADGNLDCGVLDWGGFGENNFSHKLWWAVNCSPYEMIRDNVDSLVDVFISTYKEYGGEDIDREEFKMGFFITAMQNFMQMVGAIPNSLKMCKASEFATITSFDDPRIASDVDGKSTLRTTVNVLNNGIRMIGEMGAGEWIDRWIQEVYVGKLGLTEKTDKEVFG